MSNIFGSLIDKMKMKFFEVNSNKKEVQNVRGNNNCSINITNYNNQNAEEYFKGENEKQAELAEMQIEEKKQQEKNEKENNLKEKRRNYFIKCCQNNSYEIAVQINEMVQNSNTTMDLRKKIDDLKDNNIIKCCFIELSEDMLYGKIFNNNSAYGLIIPNYNLNNYLKDGYANFYNNLNDYDKQEVDRQLEEILRDEKIDI